MLERPRSDIQISHGMKSRDKTVVVSGIRGTGEDSVKRTEDLLRKAVES